MSAGLSAVDARRVTERALQHLEEPLTRVPRIRAVAAGKAALGMAQAADAVLGRRLTAGVITAPASAVEEGRWRVFAATHPAPGPASEAAARAALALADQTATEHSVLLVCLSGGASAMLAAPADGLTIADKAATTAILLRAGLDIGDVNLVRRHLSAIKGGQLAARARRTVTVAISDVCTPVEDDPVVIGSGPTVGDPTTFADALAVIDRADLRALLPATVVGHLEAGALGKLDGPVPPDDARLRDSSYWVVASRRDAMRAARETAVRLGYHAVVRSEPVVGDARHAWTLLAPLAEDLPRPACVIASGETTVRVTGRGRGGRNQEVVLGALPWLARGGPSAFASVGTDGIDGPTDAAGAMVDDAALARLGPDGAARLAHALETNDSYPLLAALDALVRIGPTGTNVGDLQVALFT